MLERRQALQRIAAGAAAIATGAWLAMPEPTHKLRRRKPVRYWHLLGGEWLAPMNRVVDLFNQSQGVYEVVPLLLPQTSADEKFMLGVTGGDPPDVMLHWSQNLDAWASSGLVQPLDAFMTRDEMRTFQTRCFPAVRANGWHNGRLYAFVEGFDLYAIYFRVDHFREAGLDPDRFPQTLEELTAVGESLNRFDSSGNITRLGFLPQGLRRFAPPFGGGFWNYQAHEPALNTPQNLRALTYLVDCRRRLGFDRFVRFNASLNSDAGASWPFISGSYSIILDGEWRVQHIARYAPHMEYRTIPLPPPKDGIPDASYTETNYLTIPTGAREPEGAWEFIKFFNGLNDPTRGGEFFPWFSWMPLGYWQEITPPYQAYLRQNPQFQTFLDLAKSEHSVHCPPVPYELYLMDRVDQADDLATRGVLTPQQALAGLARDVAHERARRRTMGYPD